MRGFFLILVLLLGPAASHAAAVRTAVIVVGPDPVAAGALQLRLESSLSRQAGLQILSKEELAIRLAAGQSLPAPDETLGRLFLEAREAYFDDRIAEAGALVDSAARLVNAGLGKPGADRVTVLVWRTALALAKDERARAEEFARTLLALAPELEPDLDVFRPSVAKLIGDVRATLPKPVEVRVEGFPAGGRLQVDDRFVESRFRTSPGAHRLTASAPGFQLASIAFDATNGLVLRLSPALQLEMKKAAAIESAVWGDGPAAPVVELAKQLGVDALVAVAIGRDGTTRAGVVDRGDALEKSADVPRDGVSDLVRWLVDSLGSAAPSRYRLHAAGHAAFAARTLSVQFASGDGFNAPMAGAGGGVAVTNDYGPARVRLAMTSLSYTRSETTFRTDDGNYEVRGGSAIDARAVGSYAFQVYRVALRPTLGVRYESDTSGGRSSFAVFPRYTRTDALAGAGVETRVGPVLVEVGGHLARNLFWQSQNGWKHPDVPMGFGWNAAVEWQHRSWVVAGEYRGEQRAGRFSGSYPVSSSVPLEDPRVFDRLQTFSISLGYQR